MVDVELYFRIFEKAPYGALICDDESYIMYANEKACGITGFAFIDIAGKNLGEIIRGLPEDDEGQCHLSEKLSSTYEYAEKTGFASLKVIKTEEGFYSVYIDDVTENKRRNEEIAGYLQRLEIAEKTGKAGCWELDPEEGTAWASDEALRHFGIEPGDNAGSLEDFLKYANDRKKIETAISFIAESGQPAEIQFTIVPVDSKTEKILFASGQPVVSKNGKIKIMGAVSNITERVVSERMLREEKNKLRQYIDIAGFIILIIDVTGRVKVANSKCCELLGLPENEITGRIWIEDFIPAGIRESVRESVWDKMIEGGEDNLANENAIIAKSGERRLIQWNNRLIRDSRGEITGVISSGEDITEKRRIEKALEESEKSLKKAEVITNSGHFEKDLITGNGKWSDGMYLLLGYEPGSFEIKEESEKSLMTGESFEEYERLFFEAARGDGEFTVEVDVKGNEGKELSLLVRGMIEKEKRRPVRVLGTCQDITGRKKHLEEIKHISYHDHLTGLYNRRFLEEEFKRLDVPRNHPLSVIMADINGLKLANDAFGHMEGDNNLKNAAGMLTDVCREDDIIARVGGDEFMVLLAGTGPEDTLKIMNRINKSRYRTEETKLPVSIALGYATKTDEKQDMDDLFKVAEDAMYRNKLEVKTKTRTKAIKIIAEDLFNTYEWERGHAKRVSMLCRNIGKAMKLPKADLSDLTEAGYYHDIGKVAVRENLLFKKKNPNKEEMGNIIRHPETGYRILSSSNDTAELAEYVLSHHEAWNGTGYPRGLSGIKIPVQSRIMAIAEAYDYMTNRPNGRRPLSKRRAFAELRKGSGKMFDPDIVNVFAAEVYPKL